MGASDIGTAHFGTALIENLRGVGFNAGGAGSIDVERLNADLEYILIEKARAKSDILQRLTNLQKHGGIRMYAEVYKWFTETSGEGLMAQTDHIMKPKVAGK